MLSPFTIVQNNFLALTSDQLFDEGDDPKKFMGLKQKVTEELGQTEKKIKRAMYELSRVVQSDDLYVHLKFDQTIHLTINEKIPVFFKV